MLIGEGGATEMERGLTLSALGYFCLTMPTFKVYAESKSFTDYSLIIVAEIYIIFRSELIRQINSGPYLLGTDRSNDESGIKKLNPALLLDMGNAKRYR